MNQNPFPGHGMRPDFTQPDGEWSADNRTQRIFSGPPEPDDLMSEALAEDLAKELPPSSVADKDRGIFERSIAARRAEKAKQQAIAAAAMAKARQLTASIRSMEDALDSLLASEA